MNGIPDLITLLLVDAHAMFREGLAHLLRREPDLALIDHASTCSEALQKPALRRVSIVLLGVNGPNEEILDHLAIFRKCGFKGRLLVLDGGLGHTEGSRLLQNGVDCIVGKREPPQLLIETIRTVAHRGEILCSGTVPAGMDL